MTISYNADVATSSAWSFVRVIFRWRASVWESVLVEFSVWTALYYVVFSLYHFVLSDTDKHDFILLAKHIDKKLDYFVLSFILGFFVSFVVDRWKRTFDNIGFIDSVCHFVNAYVRATDEESRLARRAIARWLCLTQVLVFRDISMRVRRRFPNYASVVAAGIMEVEEQKALEQADAAGFGSFWLPFNWIFTACARLHERGVIRGDQFLMSLLHEVRIFRDHMKKLQSYDSVPIPLAYPQVVFVAVRVYFALCLISRQAYATIDLKDAKGILDHGDELPGNYRFFPFMTMIQFIIMMGWLKVAEALINPMGEDEDDFECNYIIDRNLTLAMLLVDEYHDSLPPPRADRLRDGQRPLYSEESADVPQHPLIGSAAKAAMLDSEMDTDEQRPTRMIPRKVSVVPTFIVQSGLLRSVSERNPSMDSSSNNALASYDPNGARLGIAQQRPKMRSTTIPTNVITEAMPSPSPSVMVTDASTAATDYTSRIHIHRTDSSK